MVVQGSQVPINSVKSIFENPPESYQSSSKSSSSSKWEKPKGPVPRAVNRTENGEDGSGSPSVLDKEMPPPSYTKNMLAKFQSMQGDMKGGAGRGVGKVANGEGMEKDDMPVEGTTKNLLAKFQNIQQVAVSAILINL